MQQTAAQGKRMSGRLPYGYTAEGTIDPEASAVVREMAGWALSGSTPWAIAKRLNTAGVTTARGKQWRPLSVRNLLAAPALAGLNVYKGEVVAAGDWDPILTTDEHGRLVRALTPDAAGRERTPRRRQWLTGVARCGLCGAPLRRRAQQAGVYVWSCKKAPGNDACGRIHVAARHLEPLVRDRLHVAVDSADLGDTLAGTSDDDPQVQAAAAELDIVHAKLTELADAYATDDISMSEWVTARKKLESRAETARSRLQRSSRAGAVLAYAGQHGALAAVWATLDVDQQRAVLRAVVDAVVVGPGRRGGRFDPDRVQFVWAS